MGRHPAGGRYRPGFVAIAAWLALSPAALADPRPFRLVGNQIVLPVKIEGRESLALLDTGAMTSSMADTLATALDVKHRKIFGAMVGASGKSTERRLTQKVTVDLGDGPSVERRLDVFQSGGAFAPGIVEAIIGMDLLENRVIMIDFERMTIDIESSRSFKAPANEPLLLKGQWRQKSLRIDLGGRRGDFLIDTAASGAVHLSREFDSKWSILKPLPASQTLVFGIDGVFAQPIASLPGVLIAGHEFADVPATVAPLGLMTRLQDGIDGVLGVDLLRRFNLVIDYGRNLVWMTPNANLDAPFRRNRIGVITSAGAGRGTIRLVAPGSPAERVGFKIGETIAMFETEAGAAISDLLAVSDGERVTAVMTDGSRRKLTAQAYY